jgi:hypothetical protein
MAGMYDPVRLSRSRFWNAVPAALAFALMVAQAALPWTAKHFVTQDGPSHLYNAVVVRDLALDAHSPYAAVYAIQRKFVSNWGTVVVFNGLVLLFGVQHAEKAMLTLCSVLAFVGLAYFIRSLDPRRSPWSPILNFLICTQFLWIGFYNFYLGMAVFPLVAGYYVRRMGEMSLPRTAVVASGLMALCFMHALAMALAFLTMAVVCLWSVVAAPLLLSGPKRDTAVAVREALRNVGWLLLAVVPVAVVAGTLVGTTGFRGVGGDFVSSWKNFPFHLFTSSSGRTGEQLLLYPAMLFYMAVGAAAMRRPEMATTRAGVFAAAGLVFVLCLAGPESAFGADALKPRLAWAVFLLGCAAASTVGRLRPLRTPVSVFVACMVAGSLAAAHRRNAASVSSAIDAYLAAMTRIPAGSTLVRVLFPTDRARTRFGFQDVVSDPLYHADALIAAQSRLIDLSDYQAGRELFPVHFTERIPDDLRHPLWMLEGGPTDTAAVLRKVLNECPIPIDYVVVVGDRPPADHAADFNATVRELDSRMDLFAADPTNAFVQVYRRK